MCSFRPKNRFSLCIFDGLIRSVLRWWCWTVVAAEELTISCNFLRCQKCLCLVVSHPHPFRLIRRWKFFPEESRRKLGLLMQGRLNFWTNPTKYWFIEKIRVRNIAWSAPILAQLISIGTNELAQATIKFQHEYCRKCDTVFSYKIDGISGPFLVSGSY